MVEEILESNVKYLVFVPFEWAREKEFNRYMRVMEKNNKAFKRLDHIKLENEIKSILERYKPNPVIAPTVIPIEVRDEKFLQGSLDFLKHYGLKEIV